MSYAPPLTEPHQTKNKPALRSNVITDEQLSAVRSLPEKLDILATQVLALDAQSSQIEQIGSSIEFIKNASQSHREETGLLAAKLETLMATVEKLASDANLWNNIEKSIDPEKIKEIASANKFGADFDVLKDVKHNSEKLHVKPKKVKKSK